MLAWNDSRRPAPIGTIARPRRPAPPRSDGPATGISPPCPDARATAPGHTPATSSRSFVGMKHRAVLAILFLIGCATGGVASRLAVPPARAGTAAVRWEHYCSDVAPDALTDDLNKMGVEGWELVSLAPQMKIVAGHSSDESIVFCAKRALQ